MKTFSMAILVSALALALGSSSAPSAPDGPTIDDLRIGEHWYGTKITRKDLLGKVVLVEIWGS